MQRSMFCISNETQEEKNALKALVWETVNMFSIYVSGDRSKQSVKLKSSTGRYPNDFKNFCISRTGV